MDWYKNYRLIKKDDGYVVEIYLNKASEEFSEEFLSNIKENVLSLDENIRNLIKEKYPYIKINAVKLIMGTVIVGSIPFVHNIHAKAATGTTSGVSAENAVSTRLLYTTGEVTASVLNLRTGPSITDPIKGKLPNGTTVLVTEETNGWYKVRLNNGTVGYVRKIYLILYAPTRVQKDQLVVNIAESYIGTPYVWGGNSPENGGFDCSGYTQYVFKQAGYSLYRISRDQATQGTYVSQANLSPGDLVFFSLNDTGTVSHVGIYIGNGQMIHCPKTGDVVKIVNINTSYWQSHYYTARRII